MNKKLMDKLVDVAAAVMARYHYVVEINGVACSTDARLNIYVPGSSIEGTFHVSEDAVRNVDTGELYKYLEDGVRNAVASELRKKHDRPTPTIKEKCWVCEQNTGTCDYPSLKGYVRKSLGGLGLTTTLEWDKNICAPCGFKLVDAMTKAAKKQLNPLPSTIKDMIAAIPVYESVDAFVKDMNTPTLKELNPLDQQPYAAVWHKGYDLGVIEGMRQAAETYSRVPSSYNQGLEEGKRQATRIQESRMLLARRNGSPVVFDCHDSQYKLTWVR